MGILIIAIVLGLLPAGIASSKGRNFFVWWIYGAAIFIVALPHALIMKDDPKAIEEKQIANGDVKKCPQCAEMIKRDALICRFCRSSVAEITVAGA